MSTCDFWTVLGDCCSFFGILGSLSDLFPRNLPLIVPVVACAASAAGACFFRNRNKTAISLMVALLPLLLFLPNGTVREKLILIPVVLYTVIYGILGRFELEYDIFRRDYPRIVVVLCVWFLLVTLLPHLDVNDLDMKKLYQPDTAFWFTALYLLSGTLLLQRQRMGSNCDVRSNWVQYATIIGSVTLVVVGAFFFKQIVAAIMGLYALLSIYTYKESSGAGGYLEYQKVKIEITEGTAPPPPSQPEWHHYNNMPSKLAEEASKEDPRLLIAVILCVLVAVAVIMLSKSKKRVEGGSEETEEVYEGSVFLFYKKKPSRDSNRNKIRKYYRDYLNIERKRGVILRNHMTSADILDAAAYATDREAAKSLRQVYIAARYNEKADISTEQLAAAKAALKRIRSTAPSNKA